MQPVGKGGGAVQIVNGQLSVNLPEGEVNPARLAELFSDALALVNNRDAAKGNFDQYALALDGLNGPPTADAVASEQAARTIINNAAAGFDPTRFRWQA